ncbi:MAG: hypothetical protein LBQ93_03395, partial [Treponema sp.]|nr:hypothetical protein [Treponema sp.]
MANKKLWLGMLVLVLVFGMMVIGCDNGSTGKKSTTNITPDTTPDTNSGPQVYQGADVLGNKYVLKITESTGRAAKAALGDSYELTITFKDRTKITSTGTIREVTADGRFTLQPSVEDSGTFSLVIDNNQISSVTGEIVLEEGKRYKPRTFGTVYLVVVRWGNRDTDSRWGEQWGLSEYCINLLDFIEGEIKPDGKYNMTLSGKTDTTLEHTLIDIWGVPSGSSGWDPSNKWMGTDINALNNQ